jgi:hypothetical protein
LVGVGDMQKNRHECDVIFTGVDLWSAPWTIAAKSATCPKRKMTVNGYEITNWRCDLRESFLAVGYSKTPSGLLGASERKPAESLCKVGGNLRANSTSTAEPCLAP